MLSLRLGAFDIRNGGKFENSMSFNQIKTCYISQKVQNTSKHKYTNTSIKQTYSKNIMYKLKLHTDKVISLVSKRNKHHRYLYSK